MWFLVKVSANDRLYVALTVSLNICSRETKAKMTRTKKINILLRKKSIIPLNYIYKITGGKKKPTVNSILFYYQHKHCQLQMQSIDGYKIKLFV